MATRKNRSSVRIHVSTRHARAQVEQGRLRAAVRRVLMGEAAGRRVAIHVVVVDDAAIRELHRRFLAEDSPTDVLAFSLADEDSTAIEGEIVTSYDTAASAAARYGWSVMDELVLYVVHGTLHLLGYDDIAPGDRRRMRRRETYYLRALGMPGRSGTVRKGRPKS